jgi:hypothetical protein
MSMSSLDRLTYRPLGVRRANFTVFPGAAGPREPPAAGPPPPGPGFRIAFFGGGFDIVRLRSLLLPTIELLN